MNQGEPKADVVAIEPGADVGLKSLARPGSLLARTAMGAGWIVGWRMTTRLLGVFSTLFLVRLLTPADFGVVTLAMSFLQGINALSEMGVNEAIMRADRVDRSVYDTGFTINVIQACAASAIMALAAVPLARFFGNGHLVGVILVLSAGWALAGFTNIGLIDCRRYLAFDLEFKIKIFPRLISIAVAIPAAYLTHSYWALVGAIIVSQVATLILSYVMHPYRPRFSFAGMDQIASFSFWMWVKSLIGLVGGRFNTVYLGRVFGAAGVGIFGVAEEIATLATAEIVGPLCTALFAGFAEARKTGDRGVETLLRVHSLIALLTFPLSAGLSLVAYPVVKLGFGVQWLPAVPLVQVMAASMVFTLFGQVSSMLFAAHAMIKGMAKRNVVLMLVRIGLVVVLVPRYGLLGAAIAAAVVVPAGQAFYILMAMKYFDVSFVWVAKSVMRPIFGLIVMTSLLNGLGLGWGRWSGSGGHLGFLLAVAVVLGGVGYIAGVVALWLGAGRPDGAERDAWLMMQRMLFHFVKVKVLP